MSDRRRWIPVAMVLGSCLISFGIAIGIHSVYPEETLITVSGTEVPYSVGAAALLIALHVIVVAMYFVAQLPAAAEAFARGKHGNPTVNTEDTGIELNAVELLLEERFTKLARSTQHQRLQLITLIRSIRESTYILVLLDIVGYLIKRSHTLKQTFEDEAHAKENAEAFRDRLSNFLGTVDGIVRFRWFTSSAHRYDGLIKEKHDYLVSWLNDANSALTELKNLCDPKRAKKDDFNNVFGTIAHELGELEQALESLNERCLKKTPVDQDHELVTQIVEASLSEAQRSTNNQQDGDGNGV